MNEYVPLGIMKRPSCKTQHINGVPTVVRLVLNWYKSHAIGISFSQGSSSITEDYTLTFVMLLYIHNKRTTISS